MPRSRENAGVVKGDVPVSAHVRVQPPSLEEHCSPLLDLLVRAFRDHPEVPPPVVWEEELRTNPDRAWKDSRIGVLRGRVLAHVGVKRFTMRVEGARLRVAGICDVATAPQLRRQGLMRKVLGDCLEGLESSGYDVALLFGIPRAYDRFGFVPAAPEVSYLIRTQSAPDLPAVGRLRRFRRRFPDSLTHLFNRTRTRCTGSFVRPTRGGVIRHACGQAGHAWGPVNSPAGYVLTAVVDDVLEVQDWAGGARDVLAAAVRLARLRKAAGIRFRALRSVHPLAGLLRLGDCQVTISHARSGGAMVRVVNLRSCLAKMDRVLTSRLRASRLRYAKGVLAMHNGGDVVHIHLRNGLADPGPALPTRHHLRAGDAVARFIIGSDEPDELLAAHGLRCGGMTREWVRILFPNRHPQFPIPDRF